MGSNHMNEHVRGAGKNSASDKPKERLENHKYKIPEYDTGKSEVVPETDTDKLNRFLTNLLQSNDSYRSKVLLLKKFGDITYIDMMSKEED
jgi:hypothetical protein